MLAGHASTALTNTLSGIWLLQQTRHIRCTSIVLRKIAFLKKGLFYSFTTKKNIQRLYPNISKLY